MQPRYASISPCPTLFFPLAQKTSSYGFGFYLGDCTLSTSPTKAGIFIWFVLC